MVLREKQFSGNNVFSDSANVLPGKYGCFDDNTVFVQRIDIFDHDNRIGAWRQNMAGIDVKCFPPDVQRFGRSGTGAKGDFGFNGESIHCSQMKIGR